MDIKKIKALTELLENSQLSAIELSEGKDKIRLERSGGYFQAAEKTVTEKILPVKTSVSTANDPKEVLDFNNVFEIKSPVVGVFYAAPSPSSPAFVTKGSKVKKGDTLCIVEAMKIMNEITAEKEGEVVDICVSDGQVVEYSQVLFKLH